MKPLSFRSSSLRPSQDLLLLQPAGLTLGKSESIRERRIYLDTPDWRILEAGRWLYFKAEPSASGVVCGGVEMEACVASPAGEAPKFVWNATDELASWLKPTIKMRRLSPRLRVDLRIQLFPLQNRRQKTVAQVHLLNAWVRLPGARRGKTLAPRLVAVPLRGYGEPFQKLVGKLQSSRVFSPMGESLYDEGMQLLDANPASPISEFPALEPHLSTTRGIQQILKYLQQVIKTNASSLLDPEDTEYLHQFRVAVRKTRSLLGRARKTFPKRELERFTRLFAWLGRSTGPARDLDVYLLKLEGYDSDWPERFGEHLSELSDHLEIARGKDQQRLVKLISGHRYRTGMQSWRTFLERPPAPRMPDAERPILDFAADMIWQRYKKVRNAGKRLQPANPATDFHRLRIQCKKLRYLLEFFASLFDSGQVGKIVAEVKKMQDILGDFNDCRVQADWLEQLARDFPGQDHASLRHSIALLSQDLRNHVESLRGAFAESFQAFDRKKNRKRFRRLFKEHSC